MNENLICRYLRKKIINNTYKYASSMNRIDNNCSNYYLFVAHPNVRLFITHGGLLSTQEAINRGVPIVGIPVFGDQETNMKKAQSAGIGVLLEYKNVTTESVKWAITEVLENPR